MEKIRELTIDGCGPYRVSNRRGILDPGKFEGEMPHAVRDYVYPEDESFGDISGDGPYELHHWTVGHRAYYETETGFVTEISMEQFEEEREAYERDCADEQEREEALANAAEALREAEEAGITRYDYDDGSHREACDSCEILYINSVRCHESGCPRERAIADARLRLKRLEDY